METEPIEKWQEFEHGVSLYYTHTFKEWDTDLLFKKPWTLSRKAEFMLGIGPEWLHLKQNGRWTNTPSGEIAADFMFWPNGKHRFGCFWNRLSTTASQEADSRLFQIGCF